MEDSLAAFLFGEHLMSYLIEEDTNIFYITEIPEAFRMMPPPEYHHQIIFAIRSLYRIKKKFINDCCMDIVNEELLSNPKSYTRFALQALPQYFPDGYTPETFIAYCAMVMGVSICLLTEKLDVMDFASGAVTTALTGFMLSNEFQEKGGFQGLWDTCNKFNAKCAEIQAKAKPKGK